MVFLPIIYVRGVAGLLFKEQALTVAYSLLASLVVALLLIPMLASKFNVQPKKGQLDQDKNGLLERIYLRLLTVTLKVRIIVFPVMIVHTKKKIEIALSCSHFACVAHTPRISRPSIVQ